MSADTERATPIHGWNRPAASRERKILIRYHDPLGEDIYLAWPGRGAETYDEATPDARVDYDSFDMEPLVTLPFEYYLFPESDKHELLYIVKQRRDRRTPEGWPKHPIEVITWAVSEVIV